MFIPLIPSEKLYGLEFRIRDKEESVISCYHHPYKSHFTDHYSSVDECQVCLYCKSLEKPKVNKNHVPALEVDSASKHLCG